MSRKLSGGTSRRLFSKKTFFFFPLRSLPAKPKRCVGWRLCENLYFHDNLLVNFNFLVPKVRFYSSAS